MKNTEVVYLAECKDCQGKYGFVTASERDQYLTTWHPDHPVVRSAESLTLK